MGLFCIMALCAAALMGQGDRTARTPRTPSVPHVPRAPHVAHLAQVPLASSRRPPDPADSLYSRARRALDDRSYDAAARLFDAIVTRFPRSIYAPDALYWKGFALYRSGNLEGAAAALEAQAQRYPNAPTRTDAAPLLIVVKGALARRGDASARRDVDAAAAAIQASGAAGSAGACTNME